jgi:hypothetical protein
VVLEKLRFGMQSVLPLADMRAEADFDILARAMIFSASGYIASLRDKSTSYPADWWQAFKARWFPQWLKERYPVMTLSISHYKVCPHLDTASQYDHLSFFIQEPGQSLGNIL